MPTDTIPESLLDLQRAFDAAHTAVVEASSRPDQDAVELDRLREVRREATMALHRGRLGTEFEGYPGQKRLQDAVRATS